MVGFITVHEAAQILQNRNLLPNLARKTGGQILDIIHGVEQDGVLKALDIEGRNFADEGEGLAAVILIEIHLE